MKKYIATAVIVLMAVLSSCEKSVDNEVPYISTEEVQAQIASALCGEYVGELYFYMFDGEKKEIHDESGTWVKTAEKDTVPNYRFSFGGYESVQIKLLDFPISMISHSLKDKSLKEAFAELPDTVVFGRYEIVPDFVENRDHFGFIKLHISPVVFTLTIEGEEHTVELDFEDSKYYEVNADDRKSWVVPNFVFDLSRMKIDGKDTPYFSQWDDDGSVFMFKATNITKK